MFSIMKERKGGNKGIISNCKSISCLIRIAYAQGIHRKCNVFVSVALTEIAHQKYLHKTLFLLCIF